MGKHLGKLWGNYTPNKRNKTEKHPTMQSIPKLRQTPKNTRTTAHSRWSSLKLIVIPSGFDVGCGYPFIY